MEVAASLAYHRPQQQQRPQPRLPSIEAETVEKGAQVLVRARDCDCDLDLNAVVAAVVVVGVDLDGRDGYWTKREKLLRSRSPCAAASCPRPWWKGQGPRDRWTCAYH